MNPITGPLNSATFAAFRAEEKRNLRLGQVFDEIFAAVTAGIADSFARVPDFRITTGLRGDEPRGRYYEISTPTAEVIQYVADEAPVLEALRRLIVAPSDRASGAYIAAVATAWASSRCEGVAHARGLVSLDE